TAIGSFLGFVLGIAAFFYQQHRQSKAKAKADRRAALDALNRLNSAASANIEALLNLKKEIIVYLAGDVEKAQKITKEVFETPLAYRAFARQKMKNQTLAFRHFYISAAQIYIMHPPDVGEYSLFSNEMPALSLFAHRAIGAMQEFNDVIAHRNTLIGDQAREDGIGDGITGERLWYFTKMLADDGDALHIQADIAMAFWLLVAEQVRAYRTHRAKCEQAVDFRVVEWGEEFLPHKNLLPSYREQLVTFEECPHNFLSLKAKIRRFVPYFSS
ncbi:MAG: hypothetical protein ABJJ12_07370, partial [Marinomonas sp.]